MSNSWKIRYLALMATISMVPAAFAGNGSGFNGPSLHPISVPVRVDRLITAGEVANGIHVCFTTGAPSRGVISVMQRLYAQIYPGSDSLPRPVFSGAPYLFLPGCSPMGMSAFSSASIDELVQECSREKMTNGYFTEYYAGVTVPGNARGGRVPPRSAQDKREFIDASNGASLNQWSLMFTLDRSPVVAGEYHFFSPKAIRLETRGMPFVAFQRIVDTSTYNQWGQAVTKGAALDGLSIILSPGSERKVRFKNEVTGQPVDLTVNTEEYVQCLQNELQFGGAR